MEDFSGTDPAGLAAKGLSELDLNGGKQNVTDSPGDNKSRAGGGGAGGGGRGRGGVDFPLRVLVSSDMVGAIIGRGGSTIRNITQQSRARVDVHSYRKVEHSPTVEKAITVYGQPENCTAACKRILEVMEEEARNVGKPTEISLKILAHNNLIGRIIGKQGGTIKKIMEDTDTRITVSSINEINVFNNERVITIKGLIPNISQAEAEVSSKLRAAYEMDLQAMTPHSMMFPGLHPTAMMSTVGMSQSPANNSYTRQLQQAGGGGPSTSSAFMGQGRSNIPANQISAETTYLYIPNSAVGAIIGTKGGHIRNIIKFSGSSVKIASVEDEEESGGGSNSGAQAAAAALAASSSTSGQQDTVPAAPQRRVTIIGAPEAQWKAQYLIFQKLREEGFAAGNEDIRLTVEIMVPSAQVGRIIGKGGQNVREMQRLTGAVIKLPEQGTSSGEETSVHIIGSFYSIQSAQRRLRAMVQTPGGNTGHSGPPGSAPVPGHLVSPMSTVPLLPNGGSNTSAEDKNPVQ